MSRLFKSPVVFTALILCTATAAAAQGFRFPAGSNPFNVNPLLQSGFKKPPKLNPLFTAFIRPSKQELMYWPNYPLTAAQVEARNREWDRKYNQSIGRQIADEIIETTINTIIYGKKKPVAVVPKF